MICSWRGSSIPATVLRAPSLENTIWMPYLLFMNALRHLMHSCLMSTLRWSSLKRVTFMEKVEKNFSSPSEIDLLCFLKFHTIMNMGVSNILENLLNLYFKTKLVILDTFFSKTVCTRKPICIMHADLANNNIL